MYRVTILLSISRLHMEDTDQIRESREWTERGQGYLIVSGLFVSSSNLLLVFPSHVINGRSPIDLIPKKLSSHSIRLSSFSAARLYSSPRFIEILAFWFFVWSGGAVEKSFRKLISENQYT